MVFGAVYFLAARLGLGFRFQNSQIGVVWPPNALLLAALLLTPRKSWWAVFATSAVAHAAAMGLSIPAWRVVWQIGANSAFAAATAEALRRLVGLPLRFEKGAAKSSSSRDSVFSRRCCSRSMRPRSYCR